MKIDGSNPVTYIQPAAQSRSSSSTKTRFSVPESGSDETEFSSVSDTAGLLSQLQQMPDVRQQRVEALREAIQNGQYQVADRQIASALYAKLLAPKVR
jgi:flagellar biosynthesis anti-sigma factor FlgM